MDNFVKLKWYINSFIHTIPYSRIHPLKSFTTLNSQFFVKRDDELSFGVSGSKVRKYQSLIPFLVKNRYKEVVVIGGAYSNHVVSITQLLIEKNIRPILFLRADQAPELTGNFLLISLFVPPEQIHFIKRKDWGNVQSMAHAYAQQQPEKVFVIEEGACQPESLAGALTLPLDIVMHHQDKEIDHFFIEAGTGLTAIALILGFAYLEKAITVHVLLLADNQETFLKKLQYFGSLLSQDLEWALDWPKVLGCVRFFFPTTAISFGAVNSTVFKTIVQLARTEGFLTDPIYSAKLFLATQDYRKYLTGNGMLLHAGGALTLMGYQSALKKYYLPLEAAKLS